MNIPEIYKKTKSTKLLKNSVDNRKTRNLESYPVRGRIIVLVIYPLIIFLNWEISPRFLPFLEFINPNSFPMEIKVDLPFSLSTFQDGMLK